MAVSHTLNMRQCAGAHAFFCSRSQEASSFPNPEGLLRGPIKESGGMCSDKRVPLEEAVVRARQGMAELPPSGRGISKIFFYHLPTHAAEAPQLPLWEAAVRAWSVPPVL